MAKEELIEFNGEVIEVLIEPSDLGQQYIEDCHVCCRPINFSVHENINGDIEIELIIVSSGG